MSNWKNTEASTTYKEALEAVKGLDPPAVGFLKDGSISQVAKQNNLIIQLLVKQSEQIADLRAEVQSLKRRNQQPNAGTEDLGAQIEVLTKKLATIQLGEKQPSTKKEKTTPFYVFRDPRKIDEQEKAKLKK